MLNSYNSESPSVLGVGLTCLDIVIGDGDTQYLNGGSCGNIISALSFLGWDSSLLTNKHEDFAGKIIANNLSALGVKQLESFESVSHAPRIIEKLNTKYGGYVDHTFLLSCPDCGQELPRTKPLGLKSSKDIEERISQFDILYSDRTSPGIRNLREAFALKGNWTVYEPNSARNVKSFMVNSLDSHIVKFSSQKISSTLAESLRQKASKGKTLLIVHTFSEEGLYFSYLKSNKEMSKWIHLPAQPTSNLVDASGAGDWCTAGLLFTIIENNKRRKQFFTRTEAISALQFGQALAAISCAFIGAQGILYSKSNDINKLIKPNRKVINNLNTTLPPKMSKSKYCMTCLLPK